MQELKAPKPRKVDPAKAARERSYERAYNHSRMEAAKAQGAADGVAAAMKDSPGIDAAVSGARQRLIEADAPKPSLPKVSSTPKAE